MILSGARVALGPSEAERLEIEIRAGKIAAFHKPGRAPRPTLDLSECLILPGLINAHDHLEFALFPRLGQGPYPNAAAWARDIHHPAESPIREHLRVPKTTRLLWGGLKNLLSGVTTVCHHNPPARVFDRNFPVRVVKRFGWAHSLAFSPDVCKRFRRTPPGWPFILHLGESAGGDGKREVFLLDEMGGLDERTVLVHGVALDRRGLSLAKKKGAALVWCPSSNLFLFGQTLGPAAFRCGIPMALGTDSPLTAQGDLLDELRVALQASRLPKARLYRMVTDQAARVLRLDDGAGQLAAGASADLAVFRDCGLDPAATLFQREILHPEMVAVAGKIKLISPLLAKQLPAAARRRLRPLAIEGRGPVLVDADIPKLYRDAVRALGSEIRLGGKRVLP